MQLTKFSNIEYSLLREDGLRSAIAIAFSILAVVGLVNGYPFSALPSQYEYILAVFRIVFFALVLARLYTAWHALPMLWGYQSVHYLRPIWCVWVVCAMAGVIGVGGPLPAALNALLFFIVFYRSRYYSIEDIYYQLASFILVFLPLTHVLSIDALLSLTFLHIDPDESYVMLVLNLYAWLLALMLLSAAFEKALTANWRRGLSFYYFVALPHLVLPKFRWLRNQLWLCKLASWATVLGQGSLWLCYFLPPLVPLAWLKQAVFGVLLLVVVDLSFIGQLFVSQFLLFFAVSIFVLISHDAATNFSASSVSWLALTGACLLLIFASARALLLQIPSYRRLIPSVIDQTVRVTSGSCPIKVFGDAHLFGLYLYRITDSQGRVYLEAFNDDASAGPYQRWHSRYYQGAMYSVTDACLAYQTHHKNLQKYQVRLDDLLFSAHKVAGSNDAMTLSVKVINPPQGFDSNPSAWIGEQWQPVYQLAFHGEDVTGEWLASPPRALHTARGFTL